MNKHQKSICKIFLFILFVSVVCSSSFFPSSSNLFRTIPNKESENSNKLPTNAIYLDWEEIIVNTGEDAGRDIAIDGGGNIYIAGKLYNQSDGIFEVFIAKYNKSGAQEWNATWNSGYDSVGYGIDIDSNSQFIYITGNTKNSTDHVNILLLKYDVNGQYQWNRTWGGNDWDIGYNIIVDSNFIYIAGFTESIGALGDVILLKYDLDGNFIWYKNWGGADTEYAYDLKKASDNSILITGFTSSYGSGLSNIFLLKFNTSEEFEWSKYWGSLEYNSGESIFIDSSDNIYIAGYTKDHAEGAGGRDIVLLKYNNSGDLKNYTLFGGAEDDCAYGIVKDSFNNTYLTGYTKSFDGIDEDLFLIKFNSTGGYEWNKIHKSSTADYGYGINIDIANNNTIYITGKANNEICLLKYSQLPDPFTLSSDAPSGIDSDGSFTLTWTVSLDANNYTLYQYDKPIVEINNSLIKKDEWNTNRTFEIKNLAKDTYYFIVEAHNNYGNTTSNCLRVRVIYPPEDFVLDNHPDNPDGDGKVNLSWGIAVDADNYSIYSHSSFIHKIENNGTLVKEVLTNNPYLIKDLTNQDIYYIVIAYNLGGKKQSNCIQVIVRRIPDNFSMTSTATNPDINGKFDLIWENSEFADNYTIYYSTSVIDNINDIGVNVLLNEYDPEFVWPSYKYNAEGWDSGTYYFVCVALNKYGNSTSNMVKVVVKIPLIVGSDDDDDDDDEDEINWLEIYGIYIIPSIFIGSVAALIGVYWYGNKILKRKFAR